MLIVCSGIFSVFRVLSTLLLFLGSPFIPSLMAEEVMAEEPTQVYVQSGDITAYSAVIWARCPQAAQIRIELSQRTKFSHRRVKLQQQQVSRESDFTGQFLVRDLQPSTSYYYRAHCLTDEASIPSQQQTSAVGSFTTAPSSHQSRPLRFIWLADVAGQGWGRNPNLEILDTEGRPVRGGYVFAEIARRLDPDFAILQGDMIYADNAIPPEQIPSEVGGNIWMNSPAKNFIALTLEEFRDNWRYNLEDQKWQAFLLEIPVYATWDDHEVTNNWYPGEILTGEPYNGMVADELADRARQAFFEYNPIAGPRIFRNYQLGQHLEIFLLDERSFRGPNPENTNPEGLEMLGQEQLEWLKTNLKKSSATWKVISTHDPLSLAG